MTAGRLDHPEREGSGVIVLRCRPQDAGVSPTRVRSVLRCRPQGALLPTKRAAMQATSRDCAAMQATRCRGFTDQSAICAALQATSCTGCRVRNVLRCRPRVALAQSAEVQPPRWHAGRRAEWSSPSAAGRPGKLQARDDLLRQTRAPERTCTLLRQARVLVSDSLPCWKRGSKAGRIPC